MKERFLAGAGAALAVLVIPLGILGMGSRETASEGQASVVLPTQTIQETLPAATEEARKVTAIVVHQTAQEPEYDESTLVTVELDGTEQELTLSEYLCGVLMGEMPASFPLEALKAQAVAARTYTLQRMEAGGVLSDDPAECQAYCDPATAQEKFGDQWEEYLAKLQHAVSETDGQVMTYDGELISATYFSCSGGKTESAQAVWGGEIPYLVSVDSPGEEDASSYESTETVDMETFLETLGISEPGVGEITYTDGGGVDTIEIGGTIFQGTELRELFGLRSTIFSMEISADAVTFLVYGYGHRVGMSQYGAKAMAEEGSNYEEILTWYYTGAELTDVSQ